MLFEENKSIVLYPLQKARVCGVSLIEVYFYDGIYCHAYSHAFTHSFAHKCLFCNEILPFTRVCNAFLFKLAVFSQLEK
jgi:hypothetical protein